MSDERDLRVPGDPAILFGVAVRYEGKLLDPSRVTLSYADRRQPDGARRDAVFAAALEWRAALSANDEGRAEKAEVVLLSALDAPTAVASRDDGLTLTEGIVADALVTAANVFGSLPQQHPDDDRDFVNAVHRCQDLLALRVARRAFPKGWPVKARCRCGAAVNVETGWCVAGHRPEDTGANYPDPEREGEN